MVKTTYNEAFQENNNKISKLTKHHAFPSSCTDWLLNGQHAGLRFAFTM